MDIYILHDGEQTGPFSEETARQMLKQGVVLSSDPAWRTGMPEWVPLNSLLHGEEGQTTASKEPVSALATPQPDAVEEQTPKAERPQRFLELCQTQGAEAIEGVTRAHCQVLLGYLDGKFPNWDAGDEKEAAQKYFFPAVAEKFPQFVRPGWKEKLQYPQPPKSSAPAPKPRVAATPNASSSPKRKSSSPVGSFIKGFILGSVIVAAGVGGLVAYKRPDLVEMVKGQLQAKLSGNAKSGEQAAVTEAETTTPEADSEASKASSTAKQEGQTKTAAKRKTAAAKAVTQEPPAGMAESVPAPELPQASTPGSTSTALFDPSPSPAPAAGATAGEAAVGIPAPKTSVKLLQSMELQSTYGKIQIPAGIQLPIVEQEGLNVKVRFQNQVVTVPVTATDLGDSGLQQ